MTKKIRPIGPDTRMVDYVGAMIRAGNRDDMSLTSLQKTAYILQSRKVGFLGIYFDYGRYGPLSPKVAFAADDAIALGYLTTEWFQERSHPFPFTVFRATTDSPEFEDCDDSRRIQEILNILKPHPMLELELAATAIYLKNKGYKDNFIEEVARRKPILASKETMDLVGNLLCELQA